MTNLLRRFTLGAVLFTFCALTAPAFAVEISVGSVDASPGDQVVVPIYLNNNDTTLSGLIIPLKYSSPDIQIDSVSFVGTLARPQMNTLAHIDNDSQYVRIVMVPMSEMPTIRETSGTLANLYITIDAGAPDQIVQIDSIHSVTYYGNTEVWVRLEMTDSLGLSVILPDFSLGIVNIRSPLDADDEQFGVPNILALNQNYPNPFNPSTTISYSIPERAHVDLRIYNILGQEVATLVDDIKPAGQYETVWSPNNTASGIYFYRLSYQGHVLTKKMTLLK